jgi:hypothetical protein
MMRWIFAVMATAFVELVTLIAFALWTLDDFSSIKLGVGGAVALAAATIVAVWSGARLISAALRHARKRRPDERRARGPDVEPSLHVVAAPEPDMRERPPAA